MGRELIDGVRPRRRRRRRARGDRHRRGPRRSAPAPTSAAGARPSTGATCQDDEDAVPRDGGGRGVAADLRLAEAGDRGDQRAGGRRRDHDDAADGHPHGGRGTPRSASSSRAAGSCPRRARAGSCRASSASARRWSGWRPGGVFAAEEALDGGLVRSVHAGRTSCSTPRASWRRRSPATRRRCRSRWRAG